MTTQFNRTVDPYEYPITLEEVQDYLKVDFAVDDLEIQTMIEGVVNDAEEYMRRALITQTFVCTSDSMASCFPLRYGPIQEIKEIKYLDTDGVEHVVDPTNYYLTRKNLNGMIIFNDDFELPTNVRKYEGWTVEYVAGYGSAEMVPSAIRTALKQHIAVVYEFREESAGIPNEVMRVLGKYKIRTI